VVTRTHSVNQRSNTIQVPNLSDPKMIAYGAQTYARECTTCHDAPGRGRPMMALHMNPVPPPMLPIGRSRKPSELFWAIKNGFKMTGMPSWDALMTDQDLWAIVAFIKALPNLSVDEYRGFLERGPAEQPRFPLKGDPSQGSAVGG
jgi:mono/diheme cytochrome c family protein